MYSILVLFVQEEFSQSEGEGDSSVARRPSFASPVGTQGTEAQVSEENRVRAGGSLFASHGPETVTLEIIWRNFFAYFLAQLLLSCSMTRSRPTNGFSLRAKTKETRMPGRKLIARATRKHWILGGLFLSLIIITICFRYGDQLGGLLHKDRGGARWHVTGPVTAQPFDERLSLRMPIPFGPVADYPLEKLPAPVREEVQKMRQRTAYFNGVYIVVMKMISHPGTRESVEDILFHAFSKSVSPPSLNMPKIDSTEVKGVYQSGALRFPAVFGNSPGQMTVVVIQPGTEDAFWCINAWGREKAADLAEKTAKEFTFK
jgi:hypothetical protein